MLDLHTHVWQHRPGAVTPTLDEVAAYCDGAGSKGITEIAITEHSHRFDRILDQVLPFWKRPRSGDVADATDHVLEAEGGGDLDAYVEVLVEAQNAGLPVLIGLEVDYLPGTLDAMSAALDDYPFDVLLGSVHWLDEWLFDAYDNEAFARRWEERDPADVFGQYVDHVLDLAASGLVDVLAHLDVIKVAGHRPSGLAGIEARLVDGLTATTSPVIELSSAGLRKPVADIYPSGSLLDDLLDAGARITTASDAHTVEQIGYRFDVLERELDTRRVGELTTFRRRRAITHPRTIATP